MKLPDEEAQQHKDNRSLIESIDKKVLYCTACETADFENDGIHEVDDGHGTIIHTCPYCGDRLTLRSEQRIKTLHSPLSEAAWITKHAPALRGASPSSVTRYFTSPYGRVKLHIMSQSWFAPFVQLDGVNSPAIRRLVNDADDAGAFDQSWRELGGSMIQMVALYTRLRDIIEAVHSDPNAVAELDYDVVPA